MPTLPDEAQIKSAAFKEAMTFYDHCIQNKGSDSQRRHYLELMKTSIKACLPSRGMPYPSEEFISAIHFVKAHSTKRAEIEIELNEFIIEISLFFYEKTADHEQKESIILAYYFSLRRCIELQMECVSSLWVKLSEGALSVQEERPIEMNMEELLVKTRDFIACFSRTTQGIVSRSMLEMYTTLNLMLYFVDVMQTHLEVYRGNVDTARSLFDLCREKKDMYITCPAVLSTFNLLDLTFHQLVSPVKKVTADEVSSDVTHSMPRKRRIKKKKGMVSSTLPQPPSSEDENKPATSLLATKPLNAAATPWVPQPRLNPAATPWAPQPRCYKANDDLEILFQDIAAIFKQAACRGYIYGSSITEDDPADTDILVPDIVSDEDQHRVNELIRLFIHQGARVTVFNDRGGYGYMKHNRTIIPVTWDGYKLEFSITEKSLHEHARRLDFTIRALYLNLDTLKLMPIEGINAFADLNQRVIQTIKAPHESFSEDPIRILRAVRLMVKGYALSSSCRAAIETMFSGDNNPFLTINFEKLAHHVAVLLEPRYADQSMQILHYSLGLFSKVYDCFYMNYVIGKRSLNYMHHLMPYYDIFFPSEPTNSMNAYQFFYPSEDVSSEDVSKDPLTAWYPAST
ncbi:MAG: hypothetical protein ACOYKA_01610 [Legionellaceae bacterium]